MPEIPNFCKNCKYWSRWETEPPWGACFKLAAREIDDQSILPPGKPLHTLTRNDLVFNTGQHFSCIHFQPKK